jgi:hypothetical protein
MSLVSSFFGSEEPIIDVPKATGRSIYEDPTPDPTPAATPAPTVVASRQSSDTTPKNKTETPPRKSFSRQSSGSNVVREVKAEPLPTLRKNNSASLLSARASEDAPKTLFSPAAFPLKEHMAYHDVEVLGAALASSAAISVWWVWQCVL